jgi:pyruvate/2-oxoacid:ferredoxin oxidoreductase alpha subunit
VAAQLIKGNEAVIKAALLAGCRSFYGYPITPASEIAEAAAKYFPLAGGTFVQAESETAAINMVLGASATGERTMTASSGPGISLMQEGISYIAGMELPCVIADVMRAGPGLGNLGPEQSDYNQMVKGGGHGSYHNIVYTPASAQEMCDLTRKAFDVADRFRTPVVVLADGVIGQMMEPVEFPAEPAAPRRPDWAVRGDAATRRNVLTSIYLSYDELERHNVALMAKYARAHAELQESDGYLLDDADIVVIGYGIVARVLRSAVEQARKDGIRCGLFRPITLWPFPERELETVGARARSFLVVELSDGQMLHDVRLTLGKSRRIEFHGRHGGNVPTCREIVDRLEMLHA